MRAARLDAGLFLQRQVEERRRGRGSRAARRHGRLPPRPLEQLAPRRVGAAGACAPCAGHGPRGGAAPRSSGARARSGRAPRRPSDPRRRPHVTPALERRASRGTSCRMSQGPRPPTRAHPRRALTLCLPILTDQSIYSRDPAPAAAAAAMLAGGDLDLRVAAVQLNSTADLAANMAVADRLTRAAAAEGAQLIVLPEKWTAMGAEQDLRASAQPLDGPAIEWARAIARELGVELVAGSILERVPRAGEAGQHLGARRRRRGDPGDLPQGAHVRRRGRRARLQGVRARGARRGDRPLARPADGVELGMSICYDLRFPELYRILAVRGARVITVPAAFTLATTRDHWETLRAGAGDREPGIRDRRQPGRRPPGRAALGRALDDRRPLGGRAGPGAGRRDAHRRRARPRAPARDPRAACPRSPTAGLRPTAGRRSHDAHGRRRDRPSPAPSPPPTSAG